MDITDNARQEFLNLVTECGYTPRPYSGRYMYGKFCLGIDVESVRETLKVAIALSKRLASWEAVGVFYDDPTTLEQIEHALAGITSDQMGLRVIVYFPDIQWDDRWSKDEDEDED